MQNKRGISQALNRRTEGIALRRATVFDVFDLSRVLIRSITGLCSADHKNDPQKLALWTSGKDPQTIRGWIASGAVIWLAERGGQVAGIGGLRGNAVISLLYVDPDHLRSGIGSALLDRLEQELAMAGHEQAHLDATGTAQDFYLRRGWQPTGAPADWNGIPQFPMRKSLHMRDRGLRPADPGDMSP